MVYSVLITGANRGIGLEFVRQYAHKKYKVFATYLPGGDTHELEELAQNYPNIKRIPMDITQENNIAQVAQQLINEKIDILINNAGIFGSDQDLEHITADTMIAVFTVNAIGPLLVTKHFMNHVASSSLKTLVAISSRRGSISYILSTGKELESTFAYSASKAALNIIMSKIALETHDGGVKTLLFHPGHVKTAMGGPNAEIEVNTSVSGMINVIEKSASKTISSLKQFFYNYDGTPMSW